MDSVDKEPLIPRHSGNLKPIRISNHALEQCRERGATEDEVRVAIAQGSREPARKGRWLCRFNFTFEKEWKGGFYALKQVAPVIVEEDAEIVVVTVYTYFF